jgi:hypothetical protein
MFLFAKVEPMRTLGEMSFIPKPLPVTVTVCIELLGKLVRDNCVINGTSQEYATLALRFVVCCPTETAIGITA